MNRLLIRTRIMMIQSRIFILIGFLCLGLMSFGVIFSGNTPLPISGFKHTRGGL